MGTFGSSKPIRLGDLAKAAGVSKGTASNVFNRPGVVRPEVREHVLSVAKEIQYHGPDPRGRALSAGKINSIGIATTEPLSYFFVDPYSRQLMTAIANSCDEHGVGISLVSAANSEELAWNMRSALVDGFILLCYEGTDKLIERSQERSLPFVALTGGKYKNGEEISTIDIDNEAAGAVASAYLAELGHQRFAVLSLEFNNDGKFGLVTPSRIENVYHQTTLNRLQGYWNGLVKHGIEPNDVPVYETLSDRTSVNLALETLYSSTAAPTALLVQSDKIALYTLDWLQEKGIKVPEQVSVIGFDGVPEAQSSRPSLTTIEQPINEIGRKAVATILGQDRKPINETLNTSLVVRDSTSAPPSTNKV